ncbi:XRE family transcriptional regulator [Rhodocytophaga aerolata]|uniref:XRE family transcriptional regulator n=1 Tax=Rhodocytophaga aerolata TaxID=455078 RepID=A0ABT8RCC1_9BACT|nr:XRE family transcriptional regulator [Rhodocytophaga aerolata]MDO1448974.1 XRE family transcriptional regulator [Rhodocytophaga aerolata]
MNGQIILRIGKKIREIRQRQQVKLHELAEEAQISKGLLSKIENGRTIPSLPVLLSLIQVLKIEMSEFFNGIELNGGGSYIHKKKEEYIPLEKEEAIGFLYQLIVSQNILNMAFEAVILQLEPDSKREKVVTDGYEFKFVLSGEVDYHLGEEIVELKAGDSLFFNGKIPHVPVNKSQHAVSMLVIYLLVPTE